MADNFTFNEFANPKIETKRVKFYYNLGTSSAPEWELQGRGIESWNLDMGSEVEKKKDVLGYVDMERSTPEPTQSGVVISLRKGSKLAEKIAEAEFTGDWSFFDNMEILKKYEYLDGKTSTNCKAKLEKGVMIVVNSMTAEAGSYINYDFDVNYANDFVTGEMPKEDGETITFIADSAA